MPLPLNGIAKQLLEFQERLFLCGIGSHLRKPSGALAARWGVEGVALVDASYAVVVCVQAAGKYILVDSMQIYPWQPIRMFDPASMP